MQSGCTLARSKKYYPRRTQGECSISMCMAFDNVKHAHRPIQEGAFIHGAHCWVSQYRPTACQGPRSKQVLLCIYSMPQQPLTSSSHGVLLSPHPSIDDSHYHGRLFTVWSRSGLATFCRPWTWTLGLVQVRSRSGLGPKYCSVIILKKIICH